VYHCAIMRVAIITETLPLNMGYLPTMLPKYLARLGAEVHVLAIDLPPYHGLAEFKKGVPDFLRSHIFTAGTVQQVDGYTVHVQGHRLVLGYTFMKGLHSKLREIDPDVVYCVMAIGWSPLLAMLSKMRLRFRLFTGSHTAATVFPLATAKSVGVGARLRNLVTRWIPGRLVSLFTEKCYCPTGDCGEIASRFFGVQQEKVRVIHLGVDTDYFFPAKTPEDQAARNALRSRLGIAPADVVCIYTGKMTEMKKPMLLASAIEKLRADGLRLRGLFIGDGSERPAVEACPSSTVLDFMPVSQLGAYYRAADIAVWLTNESTSMLDAAACGLPLIVSDRIYQDHVTGNGLSYVMGDFENLCEKLRQLYDVECRRVLGENGVRKMLAGFTWELAAQARLRDFREAIGGSARPHTEGIARH
jgi:glycosyltransferase involved in cell wall biosynthesis